MDIFYHCAMSDLVQQPMHDMALKLKDLPFHFLCHTFVDAKKKARVNGPLFCYSKNMLGIWNFLHALMWIDTLDCCLFREMCSEVWQPYTPNMSLVDVFLVTAATERLMPAHLASLHIAPPLFPCYCG